MKPLDYPKSNQTSSLYPSDKAKPSYNWNAKNLSPLIQDAIESELIHPTKLISCELDSPIPLPINFKQRFSKLMPKIDAYIFEIPFNLETEIRNYYLSAEKESNNKEGDVQIYFSIIRDVSTTQLLIGTREEIITSTISAIGAKFTDGEFNHVVMDLLIESYMYEPSVLKEFSSGRLFASFNPVALTIPMVNQVADTDLLWAPIDNYIVFFYGSNKFGITTQSHFQTIKKYLYEQPTKNY